MCSLTTVDIISSISMNSPLWEHRDKSEDKYYESKPYYGIKGIKGRLPHSWIVLFCFAIAAFGVATQLIVIRYVVGIIINFQLFFIFIFINILVMLYQESCDSPR